MSREGRIGLNHQINEEAARWYVEFRTGDIDAAGRRAFDAWVRASPQHLGAFIEVGALWNRAAGLDPHNRFPLEALLARAREDGIVVPLARDSNLEEAPAPRRSGVSGVLRRLSFRTGLRMRTVLAAVVLLVGGSLVTWSVLVDRETYGTQVGEQRSLKLSDGSTMALNSRSKARFEFTGSTRTVDLLEGEALFRVAKDVSRPFIVRANGTSIRAVGTEFDVNERSRGTVVTVLEGRVAVLASSAHTDPAAGARSRPVRPALVTDATVFLSAGEQIDLAQGATRTPTRTNASSATAWTQGRVILQSATLEEVAEEFNRYSERRLVAEDHAEVPFRLSGVFSTDPGFLISYLRERPDLEVRESATQILLIRTGVN